MKKFKIPQIPQTTSKSIRFPNDVIDEVESVLVGTDCTFSAFVVEAVRVALENLKEEWDGGSKGRIYTKGKRGKGYRDG